MGVKNTIVAVAVFVVAGISAIIVGAFMLRGTMRMWDKKDDDNLKRETD